MVECEVVHVFHLYAMSCAGVQIYIYIHIQFKMYYV